MSNLEQKFTAFESQAATQHNALMARLADTNAKLDALITAMGGAPPTASATLADVIAAIVAQTAVLSDVHLDTISMDQKLLAIRNEQADIHLDTISMDQKLLAIRNEQADIHLDTISMDQKLLAIRDEQATIRPLLDYIYQLMLLIEPNIDDIRRALGLPTGDATTTVLGRLGLINFATSAISASTGALSGPAVGTQLALLKRIQDLSKCGCPDEGPSLEDDQTCADPYESAGMWLGPFGALGGTDVLVATFAPPLPAGISFGSIFGITTDYTELHRDDWAGWRVYVSSGDAQFAISPTNLGRYPTNSWVNLQSGAGNYAFSVSSRASIKVYLCGPGIVDPPVPQCETYISQNVTAYGQANPHVVWPAPIPSTNNIFNGGDASANVFALMDFFDYTFSSPDSNARAITWDGASWQDFDFGGTPVTITRHTTIVRVVLGATIIVCPPGVQS